MKISLIKPHQSNSGFTLIELLIVMGVLAVVVVTILVTLNPSEAQKKARDTKRIKDLATLEAIVLQYINDGNPPMCTSWCVSKPSGNVQSQSSNASWISQNEGNYNRTNPSVDLSKYATTIPVDPLNNQNATVIGGTSLSIITRAELVQYYLKMKGSDYIIQSVQESKSNINNLNINGNGGPPMYVNVSSDLSSTW